MFVLTVKLLTEVEFVCFVVNVTQKYNPVPSDYSPF